MILPFLLALASATPAHAAPAAAPAPAAKAGAKKVLEKPSIEPKTEAGCGILVPDGEKKPAVYKADASLKVLGGPEKLTLPKTEDKIAGIRCTRDTIVPGDGDGRVLIELNRPLVLTDGARTGALHFKTEKGKLPQYEYSMIKGTLSETEKAAVVARLDILQVRLQQLAKQMADAKAKKDAAPISTKKQ
jgi:hypothetical protein